MSESKTSSRHLTAEQRRYQAVQLRLAGADFDAIAKAMGVSKSSAWRTVNKALERLRDVTDASAAELRRVELLRLEAATKAVYPDVLKGNLSAVDRFVRLSERRSALMGLDAAKGLQLTGPDGGPVLVGGGIGDEWNLGSLTPEQMKQLREIEAAATGGRKDGNR